MVHRLGVQQEGRVGDQRIQHALSHLQEGERPQRNNLYYITDEYCILEETHHALRHDTGLQ